MQRPNVVEEITNSLSSQFDIGKLKREIKQLEKELKSVEKNEETQYNILCQIGLEGKYQNWSFEKVEKNIEVILKTKNNLELRLQEKQNELKAAQEEELDAENIKFILEHFEEALQFASKDQQRQLLRSILKEVQLEQREIDGKVKILPKSLTLKVSGEQINMVKDSLGSAENGVETVVLLTRKNGGGYQVEIDIPIHCDESGELAKEEKATYSNIKKYIYDKFGVNVHTNHIAQIKRACGMNMRECYHKSKKENPWIDVCTPEKAEYIKEALRYYNVI